MTRDKTLKSQNRKWLTGYLLAQVLLFGLFCGVVAFSLEDFDELLSRIKTPGGLFPLIAFPLSIVLEGILSNNYKAILVFWRLRNPLPGCRAFSDIARQDPRIDMDRLVELFPEGLPQEPAKQNREWYRLYRKYKSEPVVLDAHKSFLLTRDLATLTVIIIPVCLIGHFIWGTPAQLIFYYIAVEVIALIGITIASRNYGKRFVANVLVEAGLHEANREPVSSAQ